MTLQEKYAKRTIRFLKTVEIGGWQLKLYSISYGKVKADEALLTAALDLAPKVLPAINENVYGLGFMGVHDGRGANFVFIDWWQDENELHHHVFISSKEAPAQLEEKSHTGISACVWDLQVICFEKEAWLNNMLRADRPNSDGYLSTTLTCSV